MPFRARKLKFSITLPIHLLKPSKSGLRVFQPKTLNSEHAHK